MPRWLRWAVQGVVVAVVLALVANALAHNWSAFRAAPVVGPLRPGWLAVSFACLAIVSLLQVQSWRWMIAGWDREPSFRAAARVWFLSNLGRYVPGKVWTVAGMLVLAEQEGIPRWAAGASAFAVQALGLGTAAAVVAAAVPEAYSPLRLIAAAALAVATIGLLVWPGGLPRLGRLLGAAAEWRALPVGTVLLSATLTAGSWLAYGAAFWTLARALGMVTLPLLAAEGVFALGYVLGLLAIFAPGGLGVREAIFFSLLTPFTGSGSAITLSIASRLELILAEVAAGLLVMAFARRRSVKEELLGATRR